MALLTQRLEVIGRPGSGVTAATAEAAAPPALDVSSAALSTGVTLEYVDRGSRTGTR